VPDSNASLIATLYSIVLCCEMSVRPSGWVQEQKAAVGKSSKALQDKEKELQKALKDAKVNILFELSFCRVVPTEHALAKGPSALRLHQA